MAGSAAAGCGTTDDSGAGGADPTGRAPKEAVTEARQALSASPTCISIVRGGAPGAVTDAQIADKTPPKNYGASETMNTGLFGTGNEQRQSLVQFDLSAIPSTQNGTTNIVSATVGLTRGLLAPTGIDVVSVHRVTSSWSESTVTWQSFGAAFDPQVEASFSNAATTFSFDLTALTTSWFTGAVPNYGILLAQSTFASNFWSSDHTDGTLRPKLDVCYTQSCDTGFADCDGNAANGCEVNTKNDVDHCGACGNACSPANGTPVCVNGACAVGACNAGFANCNNVAADGCETNTNTSVNNCGTCGHACSLPHATAACSAGGCVISSCHAGYADCDGNPANGCEINLATDPTHCGTCATACSVANGTPACLSGSCAVAACNPGFANCNGLVADGCEINTTNNPTNCGGCGILCLAANGTATCAASTCQIAACNSGFGDCDNNPANGCETNLSTNGSNCGACGNNCATACSAHVTATTCSAGACAITGCQAGFFNVDNVCSDGCECQSSNTGATCSSPTILGTLSIGQSTTYTANLVPSGQEAYLRVTFTGSASTSYHPHVSLSAGAAEFVFDVLTNCSGGVMGCGAEGGASTNKTDWEIYYTGGDPNSFMFNPIPPVGTGGTVLIHVYRRPGLPLTCNNYTLTISN